MKSKLRIALLVVASLSPAPAALAHHSFAMFDLAKTMTMTGTVKELQWTAPHVLLWVVEDPQGGQATGRLWTIELSTGPAPLSRLGWTKRSVAPGDRVRVELSPSSPARCCPAGPRRRTWTIFPNCRPGPVRRRAEGASTMIRAICEWLAATPLSAMIGGTHWVVPAVQTIHILAIAVVLSSVLMVELRVLGFAGRSQSMAQTLRRFLPWLSGGLVVLAATGALLVVGEPARSLVNAAFWTKMGLLAIALAATLGYQRAQWRGTQGPAAGAPAGVAARGIAVLVLLLWFAIAVAGRWIAYAGDH
jgi:hypothetical protein